MDDPNELARRLETAEIEIERVRTTLEVTGTLDLDAAVLNRNGVLEAIGRGRRWLARRGDVYGLIVVWLPGAEDLSLSEAERRENLRHLSATISAGLREVDEVGRIDPETFAAVLMDLQPDSITIVTDRVHRMLQEAVASIPTITAVRIGAVEVADVEPAAAVTLDEAVDVARRSPDGAPRVVRV